MYTDTKNLANNTNNVDMTYARLHAAKSKGRLGKVWRPLLRLITKKPETTQNSSIRHPNNINLNNVPQVSSEMVVPLTVELQPKTMPSDEELQHWNEENFNQYSITEQEADIALIKSASIEKTPAQNYQNCIYGRNCQDLMHDHSDVAKVLQPDTEQTYIWNAEDQKLDEELLNAWYIYHYGRFPMQASLC